MRKGNPKYPAYLKRRQQKLERSRLRRKAAHKRSTQTFCDPTSHDFVPHHENNENVVDVTVPECFSILENPEKTIGFFNTLRRFITSGSRDKVINFDFRAVRHLTIDALMYLVAVIKNTHIPSPYLKGFQGNMPTEPAPRNLFVKSGFLNFVHSKHKRIEPDNAHVQIFFDKSNSDTVAPKRIVDFIVNNSHVPNSKLHFLYEMIMEMETNSHEHAYSCIKDNTMGCNWLAYAEDSGDYYRFTFLDTGVGMYKTMHREWHEFLKLQDSEASCVISAFDGVLLRSKTKLKTRGHGLPSIKSVAVSNRIQNLQVITNKAFCKMTDGCDSMSGQDVSASLKGTIYYWEISKASLGAQQERRVIYGKDYTGCNRFY